MVTFEPLTLVRYHLRQQGGFNNTLSVGTITLAAPLAAGAAININFTLDIVQEGTFRFLVNVEALP